MKIIGSTVLLLVAALNGCPSSGPSDPGVGDTETLQQDIERCAKKDGIWSRLGESGLYTCVEQTGEGQKACTTGRDCDGECLARSNTCAPFKPLVGCNEVISDGGLPQTVCFN